MQFPTHHLRIVDHISPPPPPLSSYSGSELDSDSVRLTDAYERGPGVADELFNSYDITIKYPGSKCLNIKTQKLLK